MHDGGRDGRKNNVTAWEKRNFVFSTFGLNRLLIHKSWNNFISTILNASFSPCKEECGAKMQRRERARMHGVRTRRQPTTQWDENWRQKFLLLAHLILRYRRYFILAVAENANVIVFNLIIVGEKNRTLARLPVIWRRQKHFVVLWITHVDFSNFYSKSFTHYCGRNFYSTTNPSKTTRLVLETYLILL